MVNVTKGIEAAIDEWDTETDAFLKRYDAITFYQDNEIGTADLAANEIAVTSLQRHWSFGYDDHRSRLR